MTAPLEAAGFTVCRSGADFTLACKFCGRVLIRENRATLLQLEKAASDHISKCGSWS